MRTMTSRILMLYLLCSFVLYGTYIVQNSDHRCTPTRCTTCLQIEKGLEQLSQWKDALLFCFLLYSCILVPAVLDTFIRPLTIRPPTLVHLKVRLDC